jgi:hypothetical protein
MFRLYPGRSRFTLSRHPRLGPLTTPIQRQASRHVPESGDIFAGLEEYWYGGSSRWPSRRGPVATEEEVNAFETVHSIKVPDDLRAYFLRFNGVEEDPDMFCFWPLSRLASVLSISGLSKATASLREVDRYYVFADYMIESYYYAIYLGDNPSVQHSVILPDFPKHPVIASNFSDFLELYLTDHPRIHGNA